MQALTFILSSISLASAAQVTFNSTTGQITCPAHVSSFCAGDSLRTNIIIRCNSLGNGQPGNCNDELAGIPPIGVKNFAPCFEWNPPYEATCTYNGITYPGNRPISLYPAFKTKMPGTTAPSIISTVNSSSSMSAVASITSNTRNLNHTISYPSSTSAIIATTTHTASNFPQALHPPASSQQQDPPPPPYPTTVQALYTILTGSSSNPRALAASGSSGGAARTNIGGSKEASASSSVTTPLADEATMAVVEVSILVISAIGLWLATLWW